MKPLSKLYLLFVLTVLSGFLTACGGGQPVTTLEGATKDAVLAYSEAKTDGLLTGLNDNDYAMFSKDFDATMLQAMSQAKFDELKKGTDTNMGAYISRQVKSVAQQGNFYIVFYSVKFEKVDMVMRVVFNVDEPHQISGLWFDK